MASSLPPAIHGRSLWGLSPFLCLWQAFARDPKAAWRESRHLRLTRSTWRRFSLRIHGKDFLADLYEASRAVGIRPFLMWGTLIGYERQGRFLDHDEDIDVGILYEDLTQKDALLAEMARRGYRLRYFEPYKLSIWRADGILHVDIDVFYPWEGKMICAALHKGRVIGAHFPAAAFDRLEEVTFGGDLKVLIPCDAGAILSAIYGEWRTPRPDYNSGRDPLNRLALPLGSPVPPLPGPRRG